MKKDLLSLKDLKKEDIEKIFEIAKKLKGKRTKNLFEKTLILYFEKPSTRTVVSFYVAMVELGGDAVFLTPREMQIGRGETIADTAKVLSRYADGIVARTYKHKTIADLAKHATIPVINGLSDMYHPCQILADLFTALEKRNTLDLNFAWIGDGNNVCNSWIEAAKIMNLSLNVATPKGYEPKEKLGKVKLTHNPEEAAKDADVIMTDTWVSMGEEKEEKIRDRVFKPFQVNSKLVKLAKKDYLFMHCLPAHRGYEVTKEIIDGKHSIVFDEAENRLHVQKAILLYLLSNI
jgi:ornithine carbamoyltransferase